MGQTISIDPAMWATIRKMAFDRQTTASKLVEAALTEYLAKQQKPPARLATKVGDDPDTKAELTRVATQTGHVIPEAVVPAIESRLRGERQVTMVAPWEKGGEITTHDKPIAKVTKVTETAAGLTVEAERVSPKVGVGAVIVGEDGPEPIVVSTPEEAKAAVAALPQRRAFTPVPKPVSPKKTSRARR